MKSILYTLFVLSAWMISTNGSAEHAQAPGRPLVNLDARDTSAGSEIWRNTGATSSASVGNTDIFKQSLSKGYKDIVLELLKIDTIKPIAREICTIAVSGGDFNKVDRSKFVFL